MHYFLVFMMIAICSCSQSDVQAPPTKFEDLSPASHLNWATSAVWLKHYDEARKHLEAIPKSAPEFNKAVALYVEINKTTKSSRNKNIKWNGISPTEKDYDDVTTYATIIGRAVACGADIREPSTFVGQWMDRTFPPSERATQVEVYATAMVYAAEQQKSGRSPDTCSSALGAFQRTGWP